MKNYLSMPKLNVKFFLSVGIGRVNVRMIGGLEVEIEIKLETEGEEAGTELETEAAVIGIGIQKVVMGIR